jgi:hypothetical protein
LKVRDASDRPRNITKGSGVGSGGVGNALHAIGMGETARNASRNFIKPGRCNVSLLDSDLKLFGQDSGYALVVEFHCSRACS